MAHPFPQRHIQRSCRQSGRDHVPASVPVHEMSIALEVCRLTEERVGVEDLLKVVEVGVEVGDLSGIESGALEFWLEVLLAEPPFSGARPVIERSEGDALQITYLEIEDGSTGVTTSSASVGPITYSQVSVAERTAGTMQSLSRSSAV